MNPVDLLTSPAGARLWRDLVDGIPAGLFVINLDGRDRTVSNASLSRLIGYEPEECLPSLLEFFRARLLPGEELRLRQRVRELTAMAPGQPAEVDVWFFHRDGSPRCLRAVLSGVAPASDGPIVRHAGACRDLTDRVDHENVLRASEAMNRSILDSSGDFVKLLSPDGTPLEAADGPSAIAAAAAFRRFSSISAFPALTVTGWPAICADRRASPASASSLFQLCPAKRPHPGQGGGV